MSKKNNILKLLLATTFMLGVQFVFAAFTTSISGHSTEKSKTSLYTLKNISKFSKKLPLLGSVHYPFRIKPSELVTVNGQTGMMNNLQATNGNTTYIYPYKIKVKVPKFKAPSPTNH